MTNHKNRKNLTAKITTSVLAGTCFALISASSAFAAEPVMSITLMDQGGGTSGYVGQSDLDPVLLDVHSKVDAYIFEQGGLDQFLDMGFTVTHTGPMNDYVEIGITPYTDQFAAELYAIFGDEQIRVVEGIQAITYMAEPGLPSNDGGVSTMVVGGPEPGEGEAAITSLPAVAPDTPVSSDGDTEAGIMPIPMPMPDVAQDTQLASDGNMSSGTMPSSDAILEAPTSSDGPADIGIMPVSEPLLDDVVVDDAAAELAPVSAPVSTTGSVTEGYLASEQQSSSAPVWPWIAGAAGVLAAAALFIRKAVTNRK